MDGYTLSMNDHGIKYHSHVWWEHERRNWERHGGFPC